MAFSLFSSTPLLQEKFMNFCPSTNKNAVISQMSPLLSLDPATLEGDDLAQKNVRAFARRTEYPELWEHILSSPHAPSEDSISRFQVVKG